MESQVCSGVTLLGNSTASISNIQQSSWTGGSPGWRPCASPKVGRYLPADIHNITENFDINSNITLSSMFRSTKWSFLFRFSDQQPVWNFLLSRACYTPSPRFMYILCMRVCVFLQVEGVFRVLLGHLMIYWTMGLFETASALRSGVFTANLIVCLSHYLWR